MKLRMSGTSRSVAFSIRMSVDVMASGRRTCKIAGSGPDGEWIRSSSRHPNLAIRAVKRLIERRVANRVLHPNLMRHLECDVVDLLETGREICDAARCLRQVRELAPSAPRVWLLAGNQSRGVHGNAM